MGKTGKIRKVIFCMGVILFFAVTSGIIVLCFYSNTPEKVESRYVNNHTNKNEYITKELSNEINLL